VSRAILDALRRVTTTAAPATDGTARAAPRSVDELAQVLGLAHHQGWRARIEGRGTWVPPDAPADVAVATVGLDQVLAVSPADLVAAAQAGVGIGRLAESLRTHGAWLPIDPPGGPDRTLGSVLATATAGPLRHGAGPVRDHVLGITVVTGDGRVLRAGGRVVKNVAGYDLAKLSIGGFGAFGVIAEVNLRLRTVAAAARTLVARGAMDPLIDAGRRLIEAGAEVATLELVSPGLADSADWLLLARVMGTEAGVIAGAERVRRAAAEPRWETLDPAATLRLDQAIARGAADAPTSIRLGVLPDGIPDTLDLLRESLGLERVTAGLGRGGLRWTGAAPTERVLALRLKLAEREIPVTIERAPWPTRTALGHFGAYREGVGRLTQRLRRAFDPGGVLVAPLEGSQNG
jgi:FAD/FMN-containing dehydrogenase